MCTENSLSEDKKHTRLYILEISYIKIILEAEGLSQNGVLPSLVKGKMTGSCVLYCVLYCLMPRRNVYACPAWQGLLICELLAITGVEGEFVNVQFR